MNLSTSATKPQLPLYVASGMKAIKTESMKNAIAKSFAGDGLLDQAKQDETFERAKALLSNDPDFQVPDEVEAEEDLGPIEENHEVADFVEPVFDIKVMSSVDASVDDDDDDNNDEVDSLSGDGSSCGSSLAEEEDEEEAEVIVPVRPKRNVKPLTMSGSIKRGKYSK